MLDPVQLLASLEFAAHKHRDQRRKGPSDTPYVNHVIRVAHTLAAVGGVRDPVTLCAAVLHDTLEDTETSPRELAASFGDDVRKVVEEVTDDTSLPKQERKRLQIEHAPQLSDRAKTLKIADKICNLSDVVEDPGRGWSADRRIEYLDWAEGVVAKCRGVNAALEACFDRLLERARRESADW